MAVGSISVVSTRRLVLVLGESALLWLVCSAVSGFREILALVTAPQGGAPAAAWGPILLRGGVLAAVCQVCFGLQDLYDWRVTSNKNQTSIRLLESIFYAGILVAIAHYAIHLGATVAPPQALAPYTSRPWTSLAALVAVLPVAHFYRVAFHWAFSRWKLNERVLFVGAGGMAKTLVRELNRLRDPGYEILGFVSCDGEAAESSPIPCLGRADEIATIASRHRASRVVVALDERRGRMPVIELLNCRLAGLRVEEGEALYERLTGKIAVQRLRPSYLVFGEGFTRGRLAFAAKRAMDLALALVGVVLAAPLALAAAISVVLDSPGPVLFGQKRVGRDGRIFTIWKFRSMRADAETGGPQWAAKNDSRVTRVGRFLRRTRIDEIPQLWNVLRNEMSFIGPRPERPFFVDELRKQIPYYMERLIVKPGLTGWAQINYQYGSSVEDALTKLQYDLYYIKNLSIWLDLMILVRTIKVVVLRRGAN